MNSDKEPRTKLFLAVGICSNVLHPLDSLDGQSSNFPNRGEERDMEGG